MNSTASAPEQSTTAGPRRHAVVAVTALIALWSLAQVTVALGSGRAAVSGRVEVTQFPLSWLTAVCAGLTLMAAVFGLVAELRGNRQRARLSLALCAATGLLLVIPTVLAVIGLLVAPRTGRGAGA